MNHFIRFALFSLAGFASLLSKNTYISNAGLEDLRHQHLVRVGHHF
jgi:hypothetical protein